MNKEIKRILIVLALYSFSGGMFYSFQELWMQSNNLSIKTIGTVFSLCAILSVSVIFLCSNLIKTNKLKKFELSLILIKFINLIILFILNGTGYNILIKFFIMLDYVVDVEIYASIYPMLALINKNDKLYAKRGLIYSSFYYIAVLIAGVCLGKQFFSINFNYNLCVLIASIAMIIAFIVLKFTNLEKYYKLDEKVEYAILNKLLHDLKNDKISLFYFMFLVIGNISYYSIMGLKVILLSNYFNFTTSEISTFTIVVGIVAVLIGIIILEKLTFKNDYINIGIKYGGRFVLYLISAFVNNKIFFLITFLYVLLLTESYTHVSDAPFINRFDGKYQLAFCNLKEMMGYFGRAIGTFLCGICMVINIRLNFIIAGIFCFIQVVFIFIAIYLRKKEEYDR